jgi:hypothetical protein
MTGHVACMRKNNNEYGLLVIRFEGRRSPEMTKLKCDNNIKMGRNSM